MEYYPIMSQVDYMVEKVLDLLLLGSITAERRVKIRLLFIYLLSCICVGSSYLAVQAVILCYIILGRREDRQFIL